MIPFCKLHNCFFEFFFKWLHFSDAAKRQEKIIAFQWTHAHENKPKCTAAKKNPVCHTSYLFGFGELDRAELGKVCHRALTHPLRGLLLPSPLQAGSGCVCLGRGVRDGNGDGGGGGWWWCAYSHTSPLVHFPTEEGGVITSSLQLLPTKFVSCLG